MNNRRATILLAVAAFFGLIAAFFAQQSMESAPGKTVAQVVPRTSVVVTKMDVAMATELQAAHLEVIQWPSELLPEGTFTAPDQLVGRVVRRPFAKGEPVQAGAVLEEGSAGGLEAVLSSKKRAVSVKVDPIVGVAGFVAPGSKVDVLATVKRFDWQSKQPYAKAVLQNVKVLAIDQKLEEVGGGEPQLVSVVTLEVDPADAEKLTFMSHEGKLQLALRSPADAEEVKTSGVTVASLAGGTTRRQTPRTSLQVVKGASVSRKTF
jgi:pilus assembly protein CpaB